MNKEEYKELKKEIREIKLLNIEQKMKMFKYFFTTFFYSTIIYGYNDFITKDTIDIWKKFKQNMLEEKKLYNYILINNEKIELESAYNFMEILDFVNERTIKYFINSLEDIEDSCEMKVRWRAEHRKKNFYTLSETDDYKLQAVGMTFNFEDIKKFLDYPEEFWKYVDKKIMYVDKPTEKSSFYSVLTRFDEKDRLIDIRVIVPRVIDLFTSLVNVHEFKHAYDLYQKLGEEITNEEIYEKSAKEKENEFIKKYVKKAI